MTFGNWLCLIFFPIILACLAAPLGKYIALVFSTDTPFRVPVLSTAEHWLYRLFGVDRSEDMTWKTYSMSLILFTVTCITAMILLQLLQGLLPFNPQKFGAVRWDTALNTAISFVTNTNWQSYSGERTMSYLTQMLGMTVQNFLSAAVGMAVLVALIRGFLRKTTTGIGNFWVDVTRSILYILLPLALIWAIILASQGVVQTLSGSITAHTLEGTKQVIAVGPVASQEAIKELGTNGGGFFNVNSAHPFENPTPLTDFLEVLGMLLIPAALPFTLGAMLKKRRQGMAIFAAMLLLYLAGLGVFAASEIRGNPPPGKSRSCRRHQYGRKGSPHRPHQFSPVCPFHNRDFLRCRKRHARQHDANRRTGADL